MLRIAIVALGLGFLLIGLPGFFRPAELAAALALNPEAPAGIGAVRAMIGAHYLAMGSTAIYAAIRARWAWLAPLAAIEGAMVLARIASAIVGELDSGGMIAAAIEIVAFGLLCLGAIKPGKSPR